MIIKTISIKEKNKKGNKKNYYMNIIFDLFNIDHYIKLKTQYENNPTKINLNALRVYLDAVNYSMPSPLFKYKETDPSTHKYKDNGKLNPNFKCDII